MNINLRWLLLLLGVAGIMRPALATVAYGTLNNFDTINNTGHKCYGFEIELDGIHATDISYTYDWNHYGVPVIREDVDATGKPVTYVRYTAKTTDGTGQWVQFTNPENPASPIGPTGGHQCTDPTVNAGCEHFGVGYNAVPASIRYNWLIDDGTGGGPIALGESVSVGTPTFTPVPVQPALPIAVNNPVRQVVPQIPAPEEPVPPGKKFGKPSWVKVIKTTSHINKPLPLKDLVNVDLNADGHPDWTNGEPDQVETEWYLLQNQPKANAANPAKAALAGAQEDLPNHDEKISLRYEFYQYIGAAGSVDGETGEAMCDAVAADGKHGKGVVGVTDANGNTVNFNCGAALIVGNFVGAQMSEFDAMPALGLIDNLQDWDITIPYTSRSVVTGGQLPYQVSVTAGALPDQLVIDPTTGILSQLPNTQPVTGLYTFTVQATDATNAVVTKDYALKVGDVAGPPVQYNLSISKSGVGTGRVVDAGSAIDCGAACFVSLNAGANVSLTAIPDVGSVFTQWSGACAGTLPSCQLTMDSGKSVTASFIRKSFALTVTRPVNGTLTDGGQISCGTAGIVCKLTLGANAQVTLTAVPDVGYQVSTWTCPGILTSPTTCTVTLDAAKKAAVKFVKATYTLTVSNATPAFGGVTSKPAGINCGATCSKTYTWGTSVVLTAKSKTGHQFTGWTGACAGALTTCTVSITGDSSVQANFQ